MLMKDFSCFSSTFISHPTLSQQRGEQSAETEKAGGGDLDVVGGGGRGG